MKKMPSAATFIVFCFSCFSIAAVGSQDDCVYAATGSSYTVPLGHQLKDSESLDWKKDSAVIFRRRQKTVYTGKEDDVDSTGSLKLTHLNQTKAGNYIPEVTNAEGISVENLKTTCLRILDPVKKPKVTTTCTKDKKKVTFTCIVDPSESNNQIKWFMADKKVAEKETGKELTRVAKDVQNAVFFCNVSNLVSSEISQHVQQDCFMYYPVEKPHVTVNCTDKSKVTFTCAVSQKDDYMEFKWFNKDNQLEESGETLTKKTKDVVNTPFYCNVSNPISSQISDTAVQNCLKESFPKELFGISIWVFIGGGAGLLILVIVTATVCCVRARRKRRI